jgi:methyl-accepting chemotaxis protein
MTLKNKLIGGSIIIALMILVGGLTGWRGISQIDHEIINLLDTHGRSLHGVSVMSQGRQAIEHLESSLLIPETLADESEKARLLKKLEDAWIYAKKGAATYESSRRRSQDDEAVWAELKTAWKHWEKEQTDFTQFIKDGKQSEALVVVRDHAVRVGMLLNQLSNIQMQYVGEAEQTGQNLALHQKWIAVTVTVFGIGLTVLFGFFFTRSITGPIKKTIQELLGMGSQFAAISGQIAVASQNLVQGTSEQARAAHNVTADMNELAGIVRKTTDDIVNAKISLDPANEKGMRAFDLIVQANRSMKKMKESSEEAGKIIKTINDIAFQTNLLSLTASVEAARAGEAGEGFTIVAEEVKTLAKNSTEAVRDTSNCIEKTIQYIDKGREMAKASMSKFIAYGNASMTIPAFMEAASERTQKQIQGIDQINESIREINRMAENNAAGAQEEASAAQEISAQAQIMGDIVRRMSSII